MKNLKVFLGKDRKVCSGEISAEERDSSLKLWIKHKQLFLQRETNFTKMKHSLRLLFDEDFLLRCTRISSDETLNYGIRFPILLQRSSNFTKLIILHHHDKVYHYGVQATLNHIRNFYWIAKARKTVGSILRKCFICNVIQKKAVIPEDKPTLPPFRIHFSYCFENVALDYAGPLFYKDVVQNKMQKCYITLFTCSVSRAIHSELSNDLAINL